MKTIFFLLMLLPFVVKAQNISIGQAQGHCMTTGNLGLRFGIDTVKIVMLVSDTSTVEKETHWAINNIIYPSNAPNVVIGMPRENFQMQDTRPYMTYGYQTSTGELLDAYKRKLGKNIVMWIAYKLK